MCNDIKYIILNYYYGLIHYNKNKNIINYINSSYLIEYIDITNYLNINLVLLCINCNNPILKIGNFSNCKCF